MLYTDIPSRDDFRALDAARGEICISIYLPTTPVTRAAAADRIVFKNLVSEAMAQLAASGANRSRAAAVEARLNELHDDTQFWAYLADGLVVFANPKWLRTYRLPTAPTAEAQVSDRFHVKPLVPHLDTPGTCFVLALSQGATRLIEVTAGVAAEVKVPGLPRDISAGTRRRHPRDRSPARRIQGSEGAKILMGQYARAIDRALRPMLAGSSAPLILASVKELAAIYRAHNSYAHLSGSTIAGNPDKLSEAELATQARRIMSRSRTSVRRAILKAFEEGRGRRLASADLKEVARAAVHGRIGTLLVDVGASVPGTINAKRGTVKLVRKPGSWTYDVLDELVGLTVRAGGDVVPVKAGSLGDDKYVGAIFRYRA